MDSSVEARLEDCRSQSALRDMGVATSGGEHHLLRSSSSMCRQVFNALLEGSQPSPPPAGSSKRLRPAGFAADLSVAKSPVVHTCSGK